MENGTSHLPIIWRDSSDPSTYEDARVGRVFNQRRPDRYPLAVVQATEESHIVEAVRLAKERGCRVSVRSGGHSWAAWSVRDEAILIELGKYKELDLDEDKKIVRVSPSTTGRVLNRYLIPRGRMFAGGHCPDVGVGGFLLQGGMGWNCRTWGWACEKLAAVDVVTADGKLVRADEEQNSDLYFAARGAGPGFPGVVTRFHLETRPAPQVIRSSAYIYPVSRYNEAFEWVLKVGSSTFDLKTPPLTIGR
jgi:FAD/FMN-containing dehydrogenase